MTNSQKRERNHHIVMSLYGCAMELSDKYDNFGNEHKREEIRNICKQFSLIDLSSAIIDGNKNILGIDP